MVSQPNPRFFLQPPGRRQEKVPFLSWLRLFSNMHTHIHTRTHLFLHLCTYFNDSQLLWTSCLVIGGQSNNVTIDSNGIAMPRIDPIIHVSFSRSCDKSSANHPRLFSKIHGIRYTRFNLKSVYGVVEGLVETVGRENVTGYSNVLSTRSWSNIEMIEMINPNVAKRCPAIVTEINSVSSRSTVDGYRRCFLIWYRLPASKKLLFFYRSFFFAFFLVFIVRFFLFVYIVAEIVARRARNASMIGTYCACLQHDHRCILSVFGFLAEA